MAYKYTVKQREFLRMSPPFGVALGYVGVVEFTPRGKTAERVCETKAYVKESTARLQASLLMRRYVDYLAREGERWEVLQRQKKEADRAKAREVATVARIEKDFRSLDRDVQQDVLVTLRAICPDADA